MTDSIDKLTQVEIRGKEIMAELHIEVILCDEDEPRIRHDTNREERRFSGQHSQRANQFSGTHPVHGTLRTKENHTVEVQSTTPILNKCSFGIRATTPAFNLHSLTFLYTRNDTRHNNTNSNILVQFSSFGSHF